MTEKFVEQNISIDKPDLKEQLDRTNRDLAVLYEVSNAMRTTLELEKVLYIILTGVTAHTGLGFNRAILFLVNKRDFQLEPKMAIGPESGEHAHNIWEYLSGQDFRMLDLIKDERIEQNTTQSSLFESIKNLKIPLNTKERSLMVEAYDYGAPLHITPDKINDYSNDLLLKFFHTKELVIMPLKAKDKVNGVIVADNLYTQKPITNNDLKIFLMLANQAGLAIENSHLYEIVKHKSHTDSITGLWNHGFFQNQLALEIENANKFNSPLSLIITDIDNFKKLNDKYGHQNGDIVLKEMSFLLKDSSRENDYVCRYGGEEFSIILTNTNKDQAYQIAERIRQRIEQHKFAQFKLNSEDRVTVSIGLATLPADAHDKEELITKADQAMYKAKFSGKNQTYAT